MSTLHLAVGIASDLSMEMGAIDADSERRNGQQDTPTTITHVGMACLPAMESFEVEAQVRPQIEGCGVVRCGEVRRRIAAESGSSEQLIDLMEALAARNLGI
jgi:hypothetical protein